MKSIDLGQDHTFKDGYTRSKAIKLPLSELDILFLEEAFFKNGIHKIKFESIESARAIVSTVLSAMGCFKNIATLSSQQVVEGSFDIYAFLSDDPSKIEDLMLNDFYFDFIYIEKSQDVLSAPWYAQFCNNLKSYGLDNSIPIIEIEKE